MLLCNYFIILMNSSLQCLIPSGSFSQSRQKQPITRDNMSDLDREIGKRLRSARKSQGYKSARVFALERSLPESTYSQHETGKRSLSPATVLRYCEWLGIEPGWLLTGREVTVEVFSENDGVPEATLNASYRQAGHQQIEKASTEDLVSINRDIFRGVLNKAIPRFFVSEANSVNMDALVEYCFSVYKSIMTMRSEHQITDSDLASAIEA